MFLVLLTLIGVFSLLFYAWLEWTAPGWLLGGPIRRALLVPFMAPGVITIALVTLFAFPFVIFVCLFSRSPWEAMDEMVDNTSSILGQGVSWFTKFVPSFVSTGDIYS